MAYAASGLFKMAGFGKNSCYVYRSNDTVATIVASGYFNTIYTQLKNGDLFLLIADEDGTPGAQMCFVTSADGAATVTTAKIDIGT